MVCYNLHLNTNPILEIELKLFTKWNSVHGVIIYTYQLADLGLARVSVQIVFLSAKRRSIQKASSPLLPENPLGIWTFKDWLIQIPVSRGQNCVQTPYLSAWFDSQFFCKRQDQRPRLSCRPFLLSHLLAKANSLPLNSSMLKDKTRLLRWRDLTGPDKLPTPPRQGSSSPPFGKNDSQMPECWHGGGGGLLLKPRFDWRVILG